jgi:hypothetical protein
LPRDRPVPPDYRSVLRDYRSGLRGSVRQSCPSARRRSNTALPDTWAGLCAAGGRVTRRGTERLDSSPRERTGEDWRDGIPFH